MEETEFCDKQRKQFEPVDLKPKSARAVTLPQHIGKPLLRFSFRVNKTAF